MTEGDEFGLFDDTEFSSATGEQCVPCSGTGVCDACEGTGKLQPGDFDAPGLNAALAEILPTITLVLHELDSRKQLEPELRLELELFKDYLVRVLGQEECA